MKKVEKAVLGTPHGEYRTQNTVRRRLGYQVIRGLEIRITGDQARARGRWGERPTTARRVKKGLFWGRNWV